MLAGIAITAYVSITSAEVSSRRIVQSSRFLTELEELLSRLHDAESGQRAYVITGDQAFLQPYDDGRRVLPLVVSALTDMAANDGTRRQQLHALGQLITQRYETLQEGITLRRQGEHERAIHQIIGRQGSRTMEAVSELVATMKISEEALLEQWTQDWHDKTRVTLIAMATGSGIAMTLLLVAVIVVRQQLNARMLARQQAEEYGREIEDLYDHSPCGYQSLDSDARIVRINKKAADWLGHTRNALLGKRFADLLTSGTRPTFDARFAQLSTGRALNDVELELVRSDGTVLPVALSATALSDASGRFTLGRSTMFDITKRRSAQRKVEELNAELERRNAALTSANQDLEGFSYSVSHDLRVPLRAIDGYARMLEEDVGDRLAADDQRKIGVIRDSTRRMGQLIDDLLAFSRVGRTPFESVVVDMTALARSCYAELREITERDLSDLALTPLPAVRGDRALLHQLLINLLSNAVKFTAKRDRPRIEVGGHSTDEGALYWVRDNGAGFDMQYVDKLFGVFQRLHGQHEFHGTGVGLAIVKRVVSRHGGRVWAEGQVDAGATFYFTLPEIAES